MAMMARSFLFVLSLALATAAPLPLPLPSLPSPSESPTPLPSSGRALASATNITGIPVNITEKIPFRVPPYNSTTSAVTSSNGTAANAPHIKTLQEEIAGGAGQFSFPTSKDTWTTVMHAPIKWTALNHSLDVYLTNSDRHLLPEDVMLVKSVPPGTLAVVTQVPKSANPGSGFVIYLTATGDSNQISRSEEFTVRPLAKTLFSSERPAVTSRLTALLLLPLLVLAL